MRTLWLKLRALFRRDQFEHDLQDELAYHRELRGSAVFGNPTSIAEQCRDLWTFTTLEDLWRDVRHAVRTLRRTPGHSLAIIGLLAAGIGANAAIFSLINAVLIREIPVKNPSELAIIQRVDVLGRDNNISVPLYQELRERQTSFADILATQNLQNPQLTLAAGTTEEVANVRGTIVSGNYFDVLGTGTLLGRTIQPSDDIFEDPHAVTVLSHDFWRRQFGGDRSVLGREVFLFGQPFTIIGITREEFRGVGGDFWVPISMQPVAMPGADRLRSPGSAWLNVMGRLKPGVSLAQAQAEAKVIYEPFRVTHNQIEGTTMRVEDGSHGFDNFRFSRLYTTPLRILMAGVGLLLLIACANVASLLLARAGARQKETAVRQVLGCGRARLVRQFLIESLLLALCGGILGLALANVGAKTLIALVPETGVPLEAPLDRNVLLFTLAASAFAAVVFGVAPAFRASRTSFDAALKSASRSFTASGQWTNRLIVVAQTALSVVLAAGAALFGQSLYRLYSLDAGFDRTQVITATVNARAAVDGIDNPRYVELAARLLELISADPGVRSVSIAATGFLTGSARARGSVVVDGTQLPSPMRINQVTRDFTSAWGLRLLAGRSFTAEDRADSPKVAVVNESFARAYFSGENAVGKRFWPSDNPSDTTEIVGVVQDSKYNDLRETNVPLAFLPLAQSPQNFNHIQVKIDGAAGPALARLRQAIIAVDPRLRPTRMETLDESLDRVISRDILLARLSGLFAIMALLLACFGIYGLISYTVSARTAEIGIRMALGADPWSVTGGVIRDALAAVAPGVVIGLIAAFFVNRAMESLLFGVSGRDSGTYVVVAAALLASAVLAAYGPGRRASRIDPAIALRCE